jgi:hypothetical protein
MEQVNGIESSNETKKKNKQIDAQEKIIALAKLFAQNTPIVHELDKKTMKKLKSNKEETLDYLFDFSEDISDTEDENKFVIPENFQKLLVCDQNSKKSPFGWGFVDKNPSDGVLIMLISKFDIIWIYKTLKEAQTLVAGLKNVNSWEIFEKIFGIEILDKTIEIKSVVDFQNIREFEKDEIPTQENGKVVQIEKMKVGCGYLLESNFVLKKAKLNQKNNFLKDYKSLFSRIPLKSMNLFVKEKLDKVIEILLRYSASFAFKVIETKLFGNCIVDPKYVNNIRHSYEHPERIQRAKKGLTKLWEKTSDQCRYLVLEDKCYEKDPRCIWSELSNYYRQTFKSPYVSLTTNLQKNYKDCMEIPNVNENSLIRYIVNHEVDIGSFACEKFLSLDKENFLTSLQKEIQLDKNEQKKILEFVICTTICNLVKFNLGVQFPPEIATFKNYRNGVFSHMEHYKDICLLIKDKSLREKYPIIFNAPRMTKNEVIIAKHFFDQFEFCE